MQETSVYNVKLFKLSVIKILGEGVRSKKTSVLRMELGQQSLTGKERKGIHKGVREGQLEREEKPWV